MGVLETLSFAAILFLSSAPQTESLSIKRRAPRSSDADLTAALAVLQRHRRQTSDMDYLKSYLLENQDKIPPSYLNALNENYGLNLENYYSEQPVSDNIYDRRMLLDAYDRNNYKDVGLFAPYKSDKRNVKRSRTVPTKAELAEIFGDINRASERTHKRQISSQSTDYSMYENNFQKNKQKVEQPERKGTLEKGNGENNNKDAANKGPTPVSTDELNSVFGDEAENKEKHEQATASPPKTSSPTTVKESKEERSVPTEGERFEDLTKYEDLANIKAEKKKRVEKRDYDSEMELSQSVLDLTRTVAALRDEVARLKIAEALEDKENDLLASALKQATLGQLQGTEGSLKKEFLDIQNAIRVEQELQSIRSPEDDDGSDETSAVESEEEDSQLAEKRQALPGEIAPNENAELGQWFENPVTEDRDEMAEEEENEKAIDELVSSLSPSERQQLAEGFLENSGYDEPSNENNCPGVNYLTSQCSVAKMAGLRIDQDAKNLCNRHEICYTCGGTLEFSQTTCDAGFRGDVIEMCGKDTECIENGAKFLWFLKSEHTYNYGYLDKCDSGCVSDFIKGL
ncbi:uncharacterized protein LOC111134781 isoform X2 [Crassostrea virginica]